MTRRKPSFARGLIAIVAIVALPMSRGLAFEWETAASESQGMSRDKLDAIQALLERKRTTAFLVIRNDKIVYEWYAADNGPTKPHGIASPAKALVGDFPATRPNVDGLGLLAELEQRLAQKLKDLGEAGAQLEGAFKRLDCLRVVAGLGQGLA